MNLFGQAFRWIGLWLGLVLLICLAGALAGALLFPVGGLLLGLELPVADMLRNGIMDGGFLALIWAPGISFVACLMWAHRKRLSGRG